MKKYLRLTILFVTIIFFSVVSVKALENEPKFNIKMVKQGKKELSQVNNKYVIKDYDNIIIEYVLDNYDYKKTYYIVETDANASSGWSYEKGSVMEIYLDSSRFNIDSPNQFDDFDYNVKICDAFECNEVYDEITLHFSFDLYEANHNSKIYVTKVMQNGQEIIPSIEGYTNKYAKYTFNSLQKISYEVQGENLQPDAKYSLGCDFNKSIEVLGSELNNGYTFNMYPTICNVGGYMTFSRKSIIINQLYQKDGIDYPVINLAASENNTNLEDYTVGVSYKNFKDKEIELRDSPTNGDDKGYMILKEYHNKDNPLTINVKGNGVFKDQDYNILIEGKKKGEVVFTKEVTVNGKSIDEGYDINLDNYTLSYADDILLWDGEYQNTIDVVINDVRRKTICFYNSIGEFPIVDSTIFYEDGKKNLSTFRGDGGINWGGGIADTNVGAFNKYTYVYINYRGKEFINNEEYDYVFEYGYLDEDDYGYTYVLELDKGKIKGEILNNIGITFKVDNRNNYKEPAYRFSVKKGDELLYASAPVLYLIDGPQLANISLSANNKNLYLQRNDWNYIATRNAPITTLVAGLGFDDDKTYPFRFCSFKYFNDENKNLEEKCQRVELKGKDLNSGKAKIQYKEKIESDVEHISFDIDNYFEDDRQEFSMQGYYSVEFVDSKDLFPKITNYVLDNNSDLIKNISKNTSVTDFTKNLSVANNGKIKIFDKTGNNEITSNVGTGMLLRVIGDYDQSILDIDVVVKGDVTGDGNVSITDLVKEKQESTGMNVLDGVYELAGDITGSNSIGTTDVDKMARDVAGIEEIR